LVCFGPETFESLKRSRVVAELKLAYRPTVLRIITTLLNSKFLDFLLTS
jgi:hypothetical protein